MHVLRKQNEEGPLVVARRGDIKWGRFPDSFPNLFIDKPHQTVRGKHLVFFASFFHPESMFAQLSGTLSPAPARPSPASVF